jgi:hypothetical protein
MIEIEKLSCIDRNDACKNERRHIELLGATLNKQLPTRTDTEYYEEHRDDRREYNKKYREEHLDELRDQKKKYNEEHREHHKKYKEEHKEELKEKSKKYREEHRDKISEQNKIRYALKKQINQSSCPI